MASWVSHGLRGSTLEDIINRTNDVYRARHLALIQKIPTPIIPVEINAKSQITLAYFNQKSTVDYMGVVQGVPVCFEAKECASENFPMQNIHEHQISFMKDFEAMGGVAFFILYFTLAEIIYYVTFLKMYGFWRRMQNGERKSFKREELYDSFRLRQHGDYLCHYLEGLKEDLENR